MTSIRDPETIEKGLIQIEQALQNVSSLRNSFKQFVQLVEQDQKGSNRVQAFSECIKQIKLDFNHLRTKNEQLKVVLESAQLQTSQEEFDWLKNQKESQKTRKKEIGLSVENKANYTYKYLSSLVFDKNPARTENFFTSCVQNWETHNKDHSNRLKILLSEKLVLSGATCLLKVTVHKAFVAELELEYFALNNTLVVHQHDIRGLKEDKQYWQDTQYLVFQKLNSVSSIAFAELSAFFARESLSLILEWLSNYYDLFTAPCIQCHRVLQFDTIASKYIPPIVRTWNAKHTYNKSIAYHRRCFYEQQNSQNMRQKYSLEE